MSEFFDLAERALNRERPGSLWSNFGYWQDAPDYPAACQALARCLADLASLRANQQVLDIGFGMGEQLRLWQDAYGVSDLIGLNPSKSQLELAQGLSLPAGFQLQYAGAEQLAEHVAANSIDVALAVDCAYHFTARPLIWQQIARALKANGVLVWSDLLVPENSHSALARSARAAMCSMSRIPADNLLTETRYAEQLAAAGLQLERVQLVTEQVFIPFANWWGRYRRHYRLSRAAHLKFEVTAAAVKTAARMQCLDYAFFVARKSRT